MLLKVWQDLAQQDQVHLAREKDLKVELPGLAEQDPVQAVLVQDSVLQNLAWVVEHLEDFRVVHQLAVEAAELAAVQQVLLVEAAREVRAKLENQSELKEKSSNKEAFQVLVEQLFQEEMARQLSDCVAEPRFRTLQTRLMPTPVS
jgi:hypothetical protein